MTIAVTGATGHLGALVIDALAQRVPATEIVALARTPEKAAALAERGISVRAFDYSAPDAAALEGVEKLLLISGNEFGQRAIQHAAVIDAAVAAGVGRIFYTSVDSTADPLSTSIRLAGTRGHRGPSRRLRCCLHDPAERLVLGELPGLAADGAAERRSADQRG